MRSRILNLFLRWLEARSSTTQIANERVSGSYDYYLTNNGATRTKLNRSGPPPARDRPSWFVRDRVISEIGTFRASRDVRLMSASLIGHLGSSTFRLSTTATVSMSLAGSCFSSESAPGPFHHGIRRRGGTISWAALPSVERQNQADIRTHLIHRPARDILPLLGSRFSPIGFNSERSSCCCRGLLPGPPELGAVNPDAVHDHG
jgi:hypothetical protein